VNWYSLQELVVAKPAACSVELAQQAQQFACGLVS